MPWYETQQGKRALDALPSIASELKKIRVILADAFREDEKSDEPLPPCTCPGFPLEPEGEYEYSVDCPQHKDKAI